MEGWADQKTLTPCSGRRHRLVTSSRIRRGRYLLVVSAWRCNVGDARAGVNVKVLWFTNVELPAVRRRLSSGEVLGGGWMDSLRVALSTAGSVQLGVAAAGTTPYAPFEQDGVRYFHVPALVIPRGVAGIATRWKRRSHDASHRADETRMLASASAVVDDFRPDLIHVHGSEGPFGMLAASAEAPVLLTLQGILLVYSRAYFSGIPASDIARDVLSAEFLKGRGLMHSSWDMRASARRELKILQTCRFFGGRTDWDKCVTSLLNPRAHYYHLDEVLRPEFYLDQWRPSVNEGFVVYTTSGPAPYKGLIDLLEAVALLRDTMRPDIRLRIGGRLEGTRMWPIIRRTVDRCRLGAAVDWLGPLSPAGIVGELRAASVYVLPSIVENSPNSLAEAMLVGTPCVATSAGGVPSLLEHGREGLLCSPNDMHGLAGMIGVLAAEPALAAHLGTSARSRARRRHDPGTVAQATVDAYKDVTARHSSAT